MELIVSQSSASCVKALALTSLLLTGQEVAITAGERTQKEPILKAGGETLEGSAAFDKLHSLIPDAAKGDTSAQWEEKAKSLKAPELAVELNKHLVDKVFVAGGLSPSVADVELFAALRSAVRSMKGPERNEKADLTRWFNHLQSQLPADVLPPLTIKLAYTAPKKEAKGGKAAGKAGGKAEKGQKRAAKVTYTGGAKLDVRVGKVVSVTAPENSDKLYVEEIDVGEDKPRVVVSGLVKFISKEELNGRMVVVVTNLKPAKLAGIMSYGLVLCASSDDHSQVEVLDVPEGSKVGDRILMEGVDVDPEPSSVNSKIWSKVSKQLRITAEGVACYDGHALHTAAGKVTAASLRDCVFK